MKKKKLIYGMCLLLLLMVAGAYAMFFAALTTEQGKGLNIDADDNIDSVQAKYTALAGSALSFRVNALILGYGGNIRTGHYDIKVGEGALHFVHRLKNGQQDPIKLIIPSVRTKEKFVEEVCSRLVMHPDSLALALEDTAFCESYGCDTANILGMFIPNTYEVYANITVKKFFDRMKKESDAFWNDSRKALAQKAGLTPQEVITLASIVDEETANNGEKPMIAGMYLNRLRSGMPLQADPTIKYALRQFALKRIYTKLTFVDSPYNTYRNVGLPPGPIRIPSVAGINAVLNYAHHEFMYMCANSNFSGTHVFAKSYSEHLVNAHKYAEALNQRGIQ